MPGEEKLMMGMVGVVMMMAVLQMVLRSAEPTNGLVLWITPITGPPTGGTSAQATAIDVYDGERYLCGVSVTNLSTRAGAPTAATLKTQIAITINDIVIADTGKLSADFAPSEAKEFSLEFTVPANASAGVGVDNAQGLVYDPNDNLLMQASLSLNVLSYPEPECTPGQEKCIGPHLYVCLAGKWVVGEYNSSQCAEPPPPPPECTPGQEMCIGPHLYICLEGTWVIAEYYSARCMY